MFFTRLGLVVAWLALVVGVGRIVSALAVLWSEDPDAMRAQLLGSITTGRAIDQGVYAILFAVALGILTEISRSLRRSD